MHEGVSVHVETAPSRAAAWSPWQMETWETPRTPSTKSRCRTTARCWEKTTAYLSAIPRLASGDRGWGRSETATALRGAPCSSSPKASRSASSFRTFALGSVALEAGERAYTGTLREEGSEKAPGSVALEAGERADAAGGRPVAACMWLSSVAGTDG